MIAFRKDYGSNNEKSKDLVKKLQQILDIVTKKKKITLDLCTNNQIFLILLILFTIHCIKKIKIPYN